MSDIDPDDLRPGDIVTLKHNDTKWRVVEPVEQRETATHSGKLVGLIIKGSPSLGDWKPVRDIDEHIPRGADFDQPDTDEQATLAEVVSTSAESRP